MILADNGAEAGFQPEPYPDSMGSMLSRHWKEQNDPVLTTVVTPLPDHPHKQWQDRVVEPTMDLFVAQKGEIWFVKLPGAGSLSELTVSDVTPKTVEFQSKFGGKSRYIRTDVEFIEMKNA